MSCYGGNVGKGLDERISHQPRTDLLSIVCIMRLLFLFAAYYSTQVFNFRPATLHEQFYENLEGLVSGSLKESAWVAHRKSAKTMIATMGPPG